jgi:hypothetical protein
MHGDNRVRFCDQCQLNVYNLSELSRVEAERLIAATEGRLCARFYRRADGTVLTKDCPVGLRALRKRVSRRVAAVFATIAGFSGLVVAQQPAGADKTSCPSQIKTTRSKSSSTDMRGVVSGNVYDPGGAAIPFAKVLLTNEETKETWTRSVNEAGRFEIVGLTPGSYALSIDAIGFGAQALTAISVGTAEIVNIDAYLAVLNQPLSGIMTIPFENVEKRIPNTTIIDEDMIRRLPIRNPIPDND